MISFWEHTYILTAHVMNDLHVDTGGGRSKHKNERELHSLLFFAAM